MRDSVENLFVDAIKHTPARTPISGVGLSLVARFDGLHGGSAWVEDSPGVGASLRREDG